MFFSMFERLYKHIANGVLAQINIDQAISKIDLKPILVGIMHDPEFQDNVTAFGDELFERYKMKAQNIIAGYISKSGSIIATEAGGAMPAIFNRQGKFNLKELIPMFLGKVLSGQNQEQTSNRLP